MLGKDAEVPDRFGKVCLDFAAPIKVTSTGTVNIRLGPIGLNSSKVTILAVTNSDMWNSILLPK